MGGLGCFYGSNYGEGQQKRKVIASSPYWTCVSGAEGSCQRKLRADTSGDSVLWVTRWLGLREKRKLRDTFGVGLGRGCHRNMGVAKTITPEEILFVKRMGCLFGRPE